MTIPSQSEFQSFLDISHWVPRPEWIEAANNAKSVSERTLIMTNVVQARDEFSETTWAHPVVDWLLNDPNAKAAFRSLRYRIKPGTQLATGEYVARSIKLYSGSDSSWLVSYINKNPCVYISGLLKAFYDYYYTNRWQIITSLSRDIKGKVSALIAGIESIEKDLLELASIEELFHGIGTVNIESGVRSLNLIKVRVARLLDADTLVLPTRRMDEMARERVLVFDLSRVIRQRYRKDKTAALASFVRVEGIENPPDQRTIERLLSKWKDERHKAAEKVETEMKKRRG